MSNTDSMSALVKQAQIMQQKVSKLQEEAAHKTVSASAGGGMVIAVANGANKIVSIKIEPEVVNPKDTEMLTDLILAAVNEALNQAQAMVAEEMKKITGSLNLPGIN